MRRNNRQDSMSVQLRRCGTRAGRLGAAALAAVLWIYAGTAVMAQAPDRSGPPKLGPAPSLKLPPIQHLRLSNGLPVLLLEKHEVPLVQIELIVMSGAALDPPDRIGLASMTAAMMEEGAASRNALELADAIDFLGASISADAANHTTSVILHTPLSKLDSALALFGDVALRPTFPSEELERNRKDRLTELAQWHDDPSTIASVMFSRTLYGPSHPYGRVAMGDEKSIRALTVGELKKFHDDVFRAGNAHLIVVGDVTAAVILPKLESFFGGWRGGKAPPPVFPSASQVEGRRIFFVDKPDAAQSEIRIGRIGAQRMTEDFFPLLVLNTVLGGSFTSRLNQNLRERNGYTYGAYSTFTFLPQPGPFIAGAAVQTEVTDKALSEFMKELKGILEPVTDGELERAKQYLTLRYPRSFQSVGQIAGQLVQLVVYNLPDDYFNTYSKNILAVTKEDVQRVAKKYIDPDNIDIVVVGDRKKTEEGIEALKLGPIQNFTVDDVLGPAPAVEGGK